MAAQVQLKIAGQPQVIVAALAGMAERVFQERQQRRRIQRRGE